MEGELNEAETSVLGLDAAGVAGTLFNELLRRQVNHPFGRAHRTAGRVMREIASQ
jgi:hypothetical protein